MAAPPAKKARQDELNGEVAEEDEDPAVTLFREYLRIPTVSRGDDYQKHYGEIRCTRCSAQHDIIMVVVDSPGTTGSTDTASTLFTIVALVSVVALVSLVSLVALVSLY